ncbi:hypothetical protein BJ508DRAFT_146225 [Ascobolus immersus RN42]|uniref:Uncharacterized protein n=1 Tax=Ascobolus immersus RN42 TaxID=1160509 RepID=A0A3N4IIZ7_ASCIM|nr:hypothetical protein BJ508DRAFT_146225 [Ascobolus immersus RN42]
MAPTSSYGRFRGAFVMITTSRFPHGELHLDCRLPLSVRLLWYLFFSFVFFRIFFSGLLPFILGWLCFSWGVHRGSAIYPISTWISFFVSL